MQGLDRLDFRSLKEQQEGRIPLSAKARAQVLLPFLANFKLASLIKPNTLNRATQPLLRFSLPGEGLNTGSFSQNSREY